ncbi:MAG: cysteine desulfurase NifS [Candidatus Auribacterota bacterium]|nr:cysteine desulfurase NifS [Candidatus Auribacterota bacterium]
MYMIYLDNNASTPVREEVLEAIFDIYRRVPGNPSSIHSFGREARQYIEESREKVADSIGAQPSEIVFTGGGTEADNMAIRGTAFALRKKGSHIITQATEHHAVLHTCQFLEEQGFDVTYLPVNSEGLVDPAEVAAAIRPETILITIMMANNETGVIQPVEEIGELAREKEIAFHSDAIQVLGKIPLSVEKLKMDLISFSAHKVYGPKGVGALYIRRGTRLQQLTYGGHHERGKRPGTENTAGIVGLGRACELAVADLEMEADRLRQLRDRLRVAITEKISRVKLNGSPDRRLPNTLNLSFEFIEGEGILLGLEMNGVAAASGSACTSGKLEPSHVLRAMGIPAALAQGSIRFSLGRENTLEDIEYTAETLVPIVKRLRSLSPFY